MTSFDLDDNQEDGIWFPYFESKVNQDTGEIEYDAPKTDDKVKLRSIRPLILERLKRDDKTKKVEFVVNPKTRGMERISYRPEKTMEELIADTNEMYIYAIMDWEGFKSKQSGEMIPVTDDNKIKLGRHPVFSRFFDRCQKILDGEATAHYEQVEKN